MNPFEYVKSINTKSVKTDLTGYNPYLTNRAFAMHLDTILLADEMNRASALSPSLQYDFYYHSVRKGSRFGFPPKVEDTPELQLIMDYYNYSRVKAMQALRLLDKAALADLRRRGDKGGNTK